MKQPNSYFLVGVISAVFAIAVFSGNSFFSTIFAGDDRGRLPRELRLGSEIGIVDAESMSGSKLKRSINHSTFAEKVTIIMDLLGAHEAATVKDLGKLGIISSKKRSARLTRVDAIEAMARIATHLSDKGLLSIPQAAPKAFRDYKVAEKYSSAIAYLQNKFIVRGYPDGSVGAQKALTNQDAVFFLYRFYEAVSSDLMSKRTNEGISFIDIPLSHPVMEAIKNLTQSGAFDKIMLRPSFDGESFLSVNDLTEIISGICSKAGKEIDLIRVKTIFAESKADGFASRKQLALMLEYLLETFAKDKLNAEKISYSDVTIEQPEYEALLKLAGCGITMGEASQKFAGNDCVTWFESARMLNEVVKYASLTGPVAEKPSRLAEKADVENLKALIRAKKEKIRQILNREK